jgi:DNA topoisomerase I
MLNMPNKIVDLVQLPKRKMKVIVGNPEKSALAANLIYVHPVILSLYENKSIEKYLAAFDEISVSDNKTDLTSEEKIVIRILENN